LIYCTGYGEPDYNKPHYNEELVNKCEEEAENLRCIYDSVMTKLSHIRYDFNEDGGFEKLVENRSLQRLINVI